MKIDSKDSFQSLKELQVENKIYKIFNSEGSLITKLFISPYCVDNEYFKKN